MLQQAFKKDTMSRAQVFEVGFESGFGRFNRGEMNVEDHARSGRPSSSWNDENIEKISKKFQRGYRRFTIDEISEEVSWSSFQRIFTEDLQMRRVAAKFVPRLVTQDQKTIRLNLSQDLKNQIDSDPKRVNLKGKRFDDVEASQRALEVIKVEEFLRCFKQWERRLESASHLMESTLKATEGIL